MRVITGKVKGHKLSAPKTHETRPALDRVKESIFNILFDVTDTRVLDLFAGSGSVGIEAISRGAKHCTFIEKEKIAVTCIHKNLHRCHLMDQATVIHAPVERALKRIPGTFDLIFVDPPYERGLVNPTLERLSSLPLITAETRIVVEHHPKEPITEHALLTLTDSRRYGQTLVSFLKKVV